jgi:hypothetical protein
MPESAREEAERLVATLIAMAAGGAAASDSSGTRDALANGLSGLAKTVAGAVDRLASVGRDPGQPAGGAQGAGGGGGVQGAAQGGHKWATGSAECCVCPICRAIAAVRDPSPQTAVRLATGAGDVASGVASLMRGLSSIAGDGRKRPARPAQPAPPSPDEAWSAATRVAQPSGPEPADVERASEEPADVERASEEPADAERASQEPASAQPAKTAPMSPDEAAAAGLDPWAAASAASAAEAEQERVAAREAARKAAEEKRVAAQEALRKAAEEARAAAAEAAERVAESAAQAKAAKATEIRDTEAGGGGSGRTPRRFDVWAVATAEAGVGDVARPTTVDHDVPGAEAPAERGDEAGDAAPGDDAV